MAAINPNTRPSIDREAISAVTREVINRLGKAQQGSSAPANSKTDRTAASISDHVITADTIARLPVETGEIFIAASSVVTPSARDETRARGISVNRNSNHTVSSPSSSGRLEVIDFVDPSRAIVIAEQLSRRSVDGSGAKIILSDTPARELYHQCTRHGEIAVMVGSIEEVDRFAGELDASVWILDMKRLNLTAAVNVSARIHRINNGQQ